MMMPPAISGGNGSVNRRAVSCRRKPALSTSKRRRKQAPNSFVLNPAVGSRLVTDIALFSSILVTSDRWYSARQIKAFAEFQ
jgi:hypothetical protein